MFIFNRYGRIAFAPDDPSNAGGGSDTDPNIDVGGGGGEGNDEQFIDDVISRGENDDTSQTQDGTQTAQEGSEGGTSSTPGQQQTGQGSAQDQQHQQHQPAKGAHGPQDLVLNDGTVIKGGAERRLYEKSMNLERQLHQLQPEYQRVERELQEAKAQVQAYERAHTSAQQLGLSAQEVSAGNQVIAAYKKDPVRTINYLLTEAKAAGHDVSGIGGQGVDTAAIQRVIEQQLKPVTEQHRAQEQQRELDQQAATEAQQFFQRYPDASVHENEIAQLLERDKNMSPDAAYYALQAYFARNGLNWQLPLSQQQGAQQQQHHNGQGQPTVPSGRGGGAGSPATQQTHQAYNPRAASGAEDNLDDIIRESMREAGM